MPKLLVQNLLCIIAGADSVNNTGVSHESNVDDGRKHDSLTEELAKNNLIAADDTKSKEDEGKGDANEKPDVEVEDADDADDDSSGDEKIEFESADLTDKDEDESVCGN